MRLAGVAAVAAVAVLPGCGSIADRVFFLEEIQFHEDGPEGALVDAVSIDAQQRFVYSPRIPVRTLIGVDENGIEQYGVEARSVMCAEPSPDALAQIVARLEIEAAAGVGAPAPALLGSGRSGDGDGDGESGDDGPGDAGAAQGGSADSVQAAGRVSDQVSTTVAELGERTQIVQLMRGIMYRACEAYANGAIDQFGYSLVLGQIDIFMNQMLGIDTIGRFAGDGSQQIQPATAEHAVGGIERIVGGSVAPGSASRLGRAAIASCLIWFAQHPAVLLRVEQDPRHPQRRIFEVEMADRSSSPPAIAVICAEALLSEAPGRA